MLTDEAGVGGVNLRFLTEIHNSFDILPTQNSPNRGEYVIHPGKGGTFKSAKPTASQGTLKRGCITESVHYLREITEEKPQDDFLSHGHERESD